MKETMRGEPSVSERDLGQKEAELEKSSKEQMGHMEGGEATKTAQRWRKEAVQAVIHLQPRDFTHHRGNHNAATATI